MPDKFIVPQFIENEDKILGPITVRQFVLSLATFFLLFLEFRLLKLAYFIPLGLLTAGIGGAFGFIKVNGQPFHVFFLNFVQTVSRPNLRVWNKDYTDAELRQIIKPQLIVEEEKKGPARKARPGSTRLRDLSLTVNTGGVYVPEEGEEESGQVMSAPTGAKA
ncbi:PrgI family protein [candidate division WWE3 bacterium]|uniref:PrgI family protein n=1 Tax=candidate division WWE3 bacterium TaxID=2053526 RepID=A0A928Y5D7_UNCKA|nr:PrgI family protein [candidate division WWE3 bacterium]